MFSQDAFNDLKGLAAHDVVTRWKSSTEHSATMREKAEQEFALARRMMHLASMAIDLDQPSRKRLHETGERLRENVLSSLKRDQQLCREAESIAANDDLYFQTFGRTSARAYMYEQGVIDLQGDRIR